MQLQRLETFCLNKAKNPDRLMAQMGTRWHADNLGENSSNQAVQKLYT